LYRRYGRKEFLYGFIKRIQAKIKTRCVQSYVRIQPAKIGMVTV
jgi:hypothetical protein